MKTKLLLLAVLFTVVTFSQTTSIPDPNFEQALIDLGYDSGAINGVVPTVNINTITSLDISDPVNNPNLPNVNIKITDLTGIEDFVALEVLNVNDNALTSINISLNTSLTHLNCSANQLTTLNVSTNTALTSLFCEANQITSLNVNTNTLLNTLACSHNQLSSLDVSLNTLLGFLHCGNNQIVTLDVSTNTVLETLFCDNNLLTTLDVSLNTLLKVFGVQNNSINVLNLSTNTALIQFYCDYNQLTSLDLSTNTSLTYLSCSNNQLTTLNVKNGNNTNVSGFDATNNLCLTCIEVDNTAYSTTNWTNIDTQTSFSTNCNLIFVPDDVFEMYLETHDANGNIVTMGDPNSMGNATSPTDPLDNYVFKNRIDTVISLHLQNNSSNLNAGNNPILDMTGIESFLLLQVLDVISNNITTINLTCLSSLYHLSIANNNLITSIDVSQNNNLRILDIVNTNIVSLDVTLNNVLEILKIDDTPMSTININQNPNLKILSTENTPLTQIDLTNNTLLEYLELRNNNLTAVSIDISNNLQLKSFVLTNSPIIGLDLSSHSSLIEVRINGNNNFTQLNIKNGTNTNLSTSNLDLTNNPNLVCIEVDSPTWSTTNWTNIDSQQMFSTDCSSTWVIYFPDPNLLAALLAITGLDANNNGNITVAEASAYTGTLTLSNLGITDITGLGAFTSITTLDLQGNSITDFSPVTGLNITLIQRSTGNTKEQERTTTSLENLLISGNTLQTINLDGLPDLKVIDISNNPNLVTVSFKNGNNAVITSFNSSNSPLLTCILVDDINASYLSSWSIDATSTFVSDEADCTSRVLSTSENFLGKVFNIYPNPTKGNIQLTIQQPATYSLYTLNGQLLKKGSLAIGNNTIGLKELAIGMYFIQVQTNNGITSERIIKN